MEVSQNDFENLFHFVQGVLSARTSDEGKVKAIEEYIEQMGGM